LQYVVQQVGGDQVNVTSLTQPGVDRTTSSSRHGRSPRSAQRTSSSMSVGSQAAVDSAVDTQTPKRVLDGATIVPLRTTPGFTGESATPDPSTSALDPHTWLDPQTMIKYASAVAAQLAQARPAAATDFQTRADALVKELTTLDTEFSAGLASCQRTVFVTSHAAFGLPR